MSVKLGVALMAAATSSLSQPASFGEPDLIVSANDGKFVRVEGQATFPRPAPPDSLAVIDASSFPPRIVVTIEGIEQSVQGPPQAVAITPNGKLAIVAAPSRWDEADHREIMGNFLQVIDLESRPPRLVDRIDIGAHPNGVAINPAGSLLVAACLDGKVRVFAIEGKGLRPISEVALSKGRLGSASFTHDGKAALVTLRDDGGLATLAVDGNSVGDSKERISSGLAPYAIDISADGRWAVASSAGLNGLASLAGGLSAGDADTIALIDVTARPFRTIQYLTVPSTVEAAAISPNGQWVVAQSMGGSNLPPENAGRRKLGTLTLFRIIDGGARQVDTVSGGEAAQGIVFGRDNKTVLVQFNLEKAIAVYVIQGERLADTGHRLKLAAGPASIRSKPR